jgi:hypothetical protein
MVDTFNLAPVEEDITFARGDTFIWERVVRDEAAAIVNITGFGYVLTVDSLKNPPDSSTNIFTVTAVIPVGTDGVFQMQFSVANWAAFTAALGEPPATGFYDLEQTDGAGDLRTVRKGKFIVKQDINKP